GDKVLLVRRDEKARDLVLMAIEPADGEDVGGLAFAVLLVEGRRSFGQVPDIDVAGLVAGGDAPARTEGRHRCRPGPLECQLIAKLALAGIESRHGGNLNVAFRSAKGLLLPTFRGAKGNTESFAERKATI